MDVFRLRRRLVEDYGSYLQAALSGPRTRIEEVVLSNLGKGMIWPDQLNSSFEEGRERRRAGRGGHPARGGVHT